MFKSENCENFEGLKIISREKYLDSRGEFLKFLIMMIWTS